MRFCNHCGKPVSEGNQFCDYCGAELRVGSNTVPVGSPFRPAADLDSQSEPAPQSRDNGFSAPGNIGDFKAGFGGQSIPEPQPSDSGFSASPATADFDSQPMPAPDPDDSGFSTSRPATDFGSKSTSDSRPKGNGFSSPGNIGAPTGDTVSDENTGTDLPGDSPAPPKEKSPKKRILIAAACLAVVACVAVTLIFLLPKIHPTSGDTVLSDDPIKLNDEVTSLVESYTDENGYVSIDDCAEVAGIVRDYAEKLKLSHEIQDYAFDENSGAVSFRFSNNMIYVYSPPLQDMLGNGNEFSVMSIASIDGVTETGYSILDKLIHGTLGGPHQAAEYIHDNCPQCTQIDKITKSHCGPGELQEKLMTIGETNTRAIFFLGHGGLLPLESGEIWSIFAVGEDPTENNNEKYRDMLAANEIVWRNSSDSYTGLCYAITPEFVKHYMAEVNGGLFFAGACHSAEDDGSMSNAFINKGFDCYIGYDNSVITTYNTSIMKYIAIYLSENDNGEFTDIHTALETAKQKCGETDAYGTRCLCIDKDSKNPFRLIGGQEAAPEPTEQEILDAYIEACHFYGSWFYSGYANSGWVTESQKYVETYENGNVSVDNFDDYYNKHCRAHDHEITTVAQLKDRLCNYFLPDFADTLLENADPIESEGKLFTYAPGPFVPMCTGVEKLESIEKTGEHTWLLTVSGHTQWDENEPIYGRVLCEYKDGKCLFSTYDEENRDYLIGNSVFDLIAELSLPSENAHNNQDIPSDAVQFNGHYYYLYDFTGLAPAEKNTWENALAYCQGVNGYLATITSPEENEFVYNYMKKRGYESAYFGLTDNGTEGTWTWCNGEALNYTNWASGEPNGGTGENYALFYYKYSDGTWNDGDFVDRATRSGEGPAFICEWGEYEVGGQDTTEPTNPPGAPESGGNATGMSYEEARSIYLDYFRNIDLESLRVAFSPYTDETVQVFDFAHCSKEDYTIQSMLADIGNDGSYELLLIVGNPKLMGPAGYPICSLLFAIHDGKVEQVLDGYFTGGTAGGGTLSVVFDTVTERHLIATESHGRDGMRYGVSTFTVFDCIDQSYTEAAVLTSAGINLDPIDQYYEKEADKIRAADPYTIEENGYLKYFLWNDTYVSKSEYEEQYNRYIAPMDDSYDLKDASFENLIP